MLLVFVAVFIAGCAVPPSQGTSRVDRFDAVAVDQTVGNNVSSSPLQRTILCLNARRESRAAPAVTNQTVTMVTNITLSTVTNLTITMVTNLTRSMVTNLTVTLAVPPAASSTNEAGAVETNTLVSLIPPAARLITNNTATLGSNLSVSKAGNQTVTAANYQTLLSRQVTVETNNQSITVADNQVMSADTNQIVTILTNVTITAVTNTTVMEGNSLQRDYYLYTELTPPPDFVLQNGESLILLVDGVRHGFSPGTSQTAFVSRKGFTSTLYKVPPEVLVDVANAQEVRIRVKGVNSVIERKMSASSRDNLKKFLIRYFVPDESISAEAAVATKALLISEGGN